MKLHRLELQAFGPFRERQTVDFDAFDADGLFLISGRTGVGKSSILDGVCYSLYGTAPRYDGGDRGLRSDHAEPREVTEARLEFTAGGRRWRVTRSPEYERPKARGEGFTTAKAAVLLEESVAGEWIGRAAKAREAGELLDEILGLNRDQFQQVILLAQNRFAEFLLAKNDERQALLRTLFGTLRYEQYEQAFEQRRRDAQQAVDADTATVAARLSHAEGIVRDNQLGGDDGRAAYDADTAYDAETASTAGTLDIADPAATLSVSETPGAAGAAVPVTTAERLSAVERAVPRAAYRAEQSARRAADAETAHDEALAAFGAQSALRTRQGERLAARESLRHLEEVTGAIEADRVRLDRARSAEALRTSILTASRARAAAVAAARAHDSALAEWLAGGETDASSDDLRALTDALGGDLAVWALSAETEHALPRLEADRRTAEQSVATIEQALIELDRVRAERAAEIAAAEPALAAAEIDAPALEPARQGLAAATTRLEAGREAERLKPIALDADAAHLTAAAEVQRTAADVTSLLQRRLEGYAGELASALVDDEPCPVCGAHEHPHPAEPGIEPVGDDDIAHAESVAEAVAAAAKLASANARDARAAHQDALSRAGGETLEALEAAHERARALVEAAEAGAAVVEELRVRLRALRDADRAAGDERDALSGRLAHAIDVRAAAVKHHDDARAAVDAARGDHASVSERIAQATRRRDRARALADAADERRRTDDAAGGAERERDELLVPSPFADAPEASAALVDPAEQATLDERIRAHDVALERARADLLALETELAGVPDELIDLTPASDAAARAREERNVALGRAARDEQVATQLRAVLADAVAAHAASAETAAGYELIAGLANAVAGRTESRMDLETFVLAAELEEIVDAANLRLDAMSSGRYRLQHTDAVGARRAASGLGIAVLDAYTGQSRSPQSLSGGETFLASLALALGLAEVVTARAGGVRLDTLFIDEGFGSLDDETLELAMRTLDELRQGGRTVGLISHVAAMKEQLPARLEVHATPQGPSVIRQDVTVA